MDILIIFLCLSFFSIYSAREYDLNEIKQEGEALVTSQLQEFILEVGIGNEIEPYVREIKKFIEKEITNDLAITRTTDSLIIYFNDLKDAVDGYLDMPYIKRLGEGLEKKVVISQTILDTALSWMNQRIHSVVLTRQRERIDLIHEVLIEVNNFMTSVIRNLNIFKETINTITNENYKSQSLNAVQLLNQINELYETEINYRIEGVVSWMNVIDLYD